MSIKARIEKLETRRGNEDDVTLGDIVKASYMIDSGKSDPELEARLSRSPLGRLLSAATDRGCRSDALVGGPAGETNQKDRHLCP